MDCTRSTFTLNSIGNSGRSERGRLISILPFQPRDIELIGPPSHDIANFEAYRDHIPEYASWLKMWGPAFSAWDEDKVLGSAGLIRIAPWRASVWVYLGQDVLAKKFLLHRKIVRGLKQLVEEHNIHRLDAEVLATDERAISWIEKLGFIFEGDKPGVGPNGETYKGFGRYLCS